METLEILCEAQEVSVLLFVIFAILIYIIFFHYFILKFRMMFMAKGKHQLVPHDQVFLFCSLYISTQIFFISTP